MYQKHLNAEENGDLQSATLEVEKFVEVLIVGPLTNHAVKDSCVKIKVVAHSIKVPGYQDLAYSKKTVRYYVINMIEWIVFHSRQ